MDDLPRRQHQGRVSLLHARLGSDPGHDSGHRPAAWFSGHLPVEEHRAARSCAAETDLLLATARLNSRVFDCSSRGVPAPSPRLGKPLVDDIAILAKPVAWPWIISASTQIFGQDEVVEQALHSPDLCPPNSSRRSRLAEQRRTPVLEEVRRTVRAPSASSRARSSRSSSWRTKSTAPRRAPSRRCCRRCRSIT